MCLSGSGFTRVELLVCLGICSVLGAAGALGLQRHLPDYRLNSTVRGLWSVIQAARLASIKNNTEVAVVLAGNRCCEAFIDDGSGPGAAAGNGVRESEERLVSFTEIAPTVAVHKITFSAGRLRFNGRGMPRGLGSFYFRSAKGKYRGISVCITGGLSIKTSNDGGRTWQRL